MAADLRSLGAREWQIVLRSPDITEAFLNPAPLPAKESKAKEAKAAKDGQASGDAG